MMAEWAWAEFHFLRPWWLALLLPSWILLKMWLHNTTREDGWQQSCDPELLQAMQIQSATKSTRWTRLYWPVVTLMVLALAGPAIRQVPLPMLKNQSALIIALDVSKSMLSDDLKPSRLQRAKFKIQDLLEGRQDGQTALVVYSGDAFVVTPLTDDTATITALLDVIDPGIMPASGTNTVAALDKAEELLKQSGITKGQVLLVTDQIEMFKTEGRIAELQTAGITTHVLAVGTAEGAPIPTAQGFLKDLRGKIVIPQVNYNELQQAAKVGQGQFSVLTNSINEDTLYDTDAEQGDETNEEETAGTNFIDDGPWLAVLIIPMLALLYRRGLLMVLCLGFMLNTPEVHAWSWDDLWLNEDQQAFRQLEKSPEQAYAQAQSTDLKAAAAYKKGDYKTATQLYPEQGQTLADHYNRGNALAQAGELEDAIDSYNQALTFDPEDADTLYNKQIVEQALEQQQQQQQQQQNQDQQNQDSESSESEEQQSQEQQQSSEQEQQEQQQQAQKDQQSEASEGDSESPEESADQQQQTAEQSNEQPAEEIELTPEEMALDAEEKQAMEQWLRRIKDDPGGLLRRKFLYQYHKRNQDGESYDNQTTEDW
ncbi:VWA domain-containing protein [Marinicella sediminis]|uniref:VWA domain-containing protein n=1 Tax=Marinicella sediminis TaxID=1792834 RepID=A0ABV7JAS7_9GAMM|nr:VWA domain-containing protein [Marinicella sediminis]